MTKVIHYIWWLGILCWSLSACSDDKLLNEKGLVEVRLSLNTDMSTRTSSDIGVATHSVDRILVLPFQKAAGRGNAGRGGAGLCPRGGPVAGQRLGRDPAGGADPGGAGSRRGEHPAGADKIIKQGRFAPGGAGRPFCGDWRQGRAGPQARRRAAPPQQSQTAETARRAVWPAAPAGPLHKPAQTAKKKSPAFAEPFPTKIIFIRQSFWETGKLFKGRWWRHRAPFLCLYYMPPRGRIPPF